MKKNLLLFLSCFVFATLFSSCMSTLYTANYKINLTEVEHKKGSQKKIIPLDKDNYSFSDSIVDITWMPTNKAFGFELKNKSQSTLKIIWDEAVLVLPTGETNKVMHSGVKYIERNNSQPPTTIIRNSSLTDLITPTGNIYWRESSSYTSGWETKEMFITSSFDSLSIKNHVDKLLGKTIQIGLPIKIDETLTEYIFVFKFNDAPITTSQAPEPQKSKLLSFGGAIIGGLVISLIIQSFMGN